jgi:hypothetical protein
MGRKKSGNSMSKAIRDVLEKSPDMGAKEVVSTLAQKGITVKPGLVYFIKGKVKGGKGRRRRRRRKLGEQVAAVAVTTGATDAIATILKVKALAAQVGGMKKLKGLVEVLAD